MSERIKVRNFLAIDLGAKSGRAIIGSLEDNKLKISEIHRFANKPIYLLGTIFWDVLNIFSEIKRALTKYAKENGKNLSGIGINSWGVDFGLLGEDGKLLGNPVHYRDERTNGMMEEAFKRVTKKQIFEETGVQFMQINTLYQLLAMKLNNSPILEIARNLLMMADLFNYFLTGEKIAEFTLATTSQAYNPRTSNWSRLLFDELNLPYSIMPPIVQPGTEVGKLLPKVGEEVGLGEVPIIAPACHDTGSAVAAVPAESKNWAFLSSGTWSLLGAEVNKPRIEEKVMEYNFTNEGGVGGTYRLLRNITGLWLLQECKSEWESEGERLSYPELIQEANQAEEFIAFLDPDAEIFLTPGGMPRKIREYCRNTGQPEPQTMGSMVRCILESIALKYRLVIERLEEILGKELEVLHIVGGGVKNELLSQFTANAIQKPVIAGPVEATACGNVLLQALNSGDVSSIQEGREVVRRSFELKNYNPQQERKWEAAYQRFIEVIRS